MFGKYIRANSLDIQRSAKAVARNSRQLRLSNNRADSDNQANAVSTDQATNKINGANGKAPA